MSLMLFGGGLLVVGGALAISEDCCCVEGGCCPDTLISGAAIDLDVEVTALTGNASTYFTIGDHWTLTETSPGIWYGLTDDNPHNRFYGVQLSCVDNNELSLAWANGDGGSAPGTDTSAIGPYRWNQDSGVCDPFEFYFTWEFNEDPITGVPAGLVGTITVKITIIP